jgi:hypothetical protein
MVRGQRAWRGLDSINGLHEPDVTVFCEKADGTKIIVASARAVRG